MPSGRHFAAYLWASVLAAGVFWLAYDEGTYGLTSRNSVAVVVLWAIVGPVVALAGVFLIVRGQRSKPPQ